MTAWTSDELDRIGNAFEIEIAALRPDGALRKPVIIWIVRAGNELYVRSYKGRSARWFQGAQATHIGRIWAGEVENDVRLIDESDPAVNEQIDAAYMTKYGHTPYARSMLVPEVRLTTLRLTPRHTG